MGFPSASVPVGEIDSNLLNRAITALLKHHEASTSNSKQLLETDLDIQVQLTLARIPGLPSAKPIRIEIPYSLIKVNDKHENCQEADVCLIVKDESKPFVQEMIQRFPKELSCIKKVLGLQSLRIKHKTFSQKRELLHRFDIFLADDRILPMLSKALGTKFFEKKKQPIPLSICRKEALPFSVQKCLRGTFMYLSSGTCVTVKAGNTSMSVSQLEANIQSITTQAPLKVPRKWSNIKSISIKTTSSVALPIYNKTLEELEEIQSLVTSSKVLNAEKGGTDVIENQDENNVLHKNVKKRLDPMNPLVKALKKHKTEEVNVNKEVTTCGKKTKQYMEDEAIVLPIEKVINEKVKATKSDTSKQYHDRTKVDDNANLNKEAVYEETVNKNTVNVSAIDEVIRLPTPKDKKVFSERENNTMTKSSKKRKDTPSSNEKTKVVKDVKLSDLNSGEKAREITSNVNVEIKDDIVTSPTSKNKITSKTNNGVKTISSKKRKDLPNDSNNNEFNEKETVSDTTLDEKRRKSIRNEIQDETITMATPKDKKIFGEKGIITNVKSSKKHKDTPSDSKTEQYREDPTHVKSDEKGSMQNSIVVNKMKDETVGLPSPITHDTEKLHGTKIKSSKKRKDVSDVNGSNTALKKEEEVCEKTMGKEAKTTDSSVMRKERSEMTLSHTPKKEKVISSNNVNAQASKNRKDTTEDDNNIKSKKAPAVHEKPEGKQERKKSSNDLNKINFETTLMPTSKHEVVSNEKLESAKKERAKKRKDVPDYLDNADCAIVEENTDISLKKKKTKKNKSNSEKTLETLVKESSKEVNQMQAEKTELKSRKKGGSIDHKTISDQEVLREKFDDKNVHTNLVEDKTKKSEFFAKMTATDTSCEKSKDGTNEVEQKSEKRNLNGAESAKGKSSIKCSIKVDNSDNNESTSTKEKSDIAIHKKKNHPHDNSSFVPTKKFQGPRKGFVFKTDKLGTGYYQDILPVVDEEWLESLKKSFGRCGGSARKSMSKKKNKGHSRRSH